MRAPIPVLAGAGLAGAASGLRSQIGLAAVSMSAPRTLDPRPGPLALLARRPVRAATATAALGELVADKLPQTPSRLGAPGLIPRVVLGALAATVLAARSGRDEGGDRSDTFDGRDHQACPAVPAPTLAVAAVLGGIAAAGAAFAGAWWRLTAGQYGRPDWPAAVIEDALAVALVWTGCSLAAGSSRTAG
ncbi:DUF4126 family protein [Streptomyces sp. IBSBF 2435]|uniref:DUF4126 family protein n=1 Tax=Streptomyces sp. IBSBF 2435 TaxID=2903531 RepID=UPI002FDBDB09